MKTAWIQDDPQLKKVVNGAGELLERFGQPRGRYDVDRWRAQRRKFGLLDFDITDKASKIQKRRRDDDFSAAVKAGRVKLMVEDTRVSTTQTNRAIYLKHETPSEAIAATRLRAGRVISAANRSAYAN